MRSPLAEEVAERELKLTEDRVVQANRRGDGGTVTASREATGDV